MNQGSDTKSTENAGVQLNRAEQAAPLESGARAMTPIEYISLASSLKQIAERLEQTQSSLKKLEADRPKAFGHYTIELFKIIFGGWPALGLLFLLLFYTPLKDALISIPEKVRSAEEIQMAGLSLKMAIKKEAAKLGETSLSETIPSLSGSAIEELLRIPADGDSLWSYTPNKNGEYMSLRLRTEEAIEIVEELRAGGLVEIRAETKAGERDLRTIDSKEALRMYSAIKASNPGKINKNYAKGQVELTPSKPIPEHTIPVMQYSLTQNGKQAVEIILKAVAAELAPKGKKVS